MTSLLLPALRIVLALLALRGLRWAYAAFVVLGLLYFPARAGFHLNPHPCEVQASPQLLLHSFSNFPHIFMFAAFFILTFPQFHSVGWRAFAGSAVLTLVMGLAVELAEGWTGTGNCRMRDLLPDATGAALGAALMLVWLRLRPRSP